MFPRYSLYARALLCSRELFRRSPGQEGIFGIARFYLCSSYFCKRDTRIPEL